MIFFGGRVYVSPATPSVVDDSAMANTNVSVGNKVVVIGRSVGGQPKTDLHFGSVAQAKAVLIDGDLMRAVEKAFAPSNQTGGPAEVIAVRVNPALQAGLTLQDGSANNVITLAATDWGAWTNQIKLKIESGSVSGKKLTTQYGQNYYSQDNVGRSPFSIQYTGAAVSATMTVNPSTNILTLFAPAATQVASIDLSLFPTIQQLVDKLNSIAGFAASVLGGLANTPAFNGLDAVTAQDVKTAVYSATANLQAIVDWFNGSAEGFITATRATGAGTVPANLPFTYLTGGSDGSVVTQDWQDCFTALQTVDVQWVAPLSPLPAIQAMADAHVQFMSNVGRMERRAITGTDLGTTDAQAIAAAFNLNSDRTSLVHLGFYEYDPNGNLTLYPPYILAALIAGMFASVAPGVALTHKTINVRGLERKLRNPTDTDALILGGVLPVEVTRQGYEVVKSITTWLVNANYNRVEQSCGAAVDYMMRNCRNAVDVLRGGPASPQAAKYGASLLESQLRNLAAPPPGGPGVLVGDAASPPYKNITWRISGDAIYYEWQASPVIPANYIPCLAHIVPYSGSSAGQ